MSTNCNNTLLGIVITIMGSLCPVANINLHVVEPKQEELPVSPTRAPRSRHICSFCATWTFVAMLRSSVMLHLFKRSLQVNNSTYERTRALLEDRYAVKMLHVHSRSRRLVGCMDEDCEQHQDVDAKLTWRGALGRRHDSGICCM